MRAFVTILLCSITLAGCTGPAALNLNPLSNGPDAAGKIDLVIDRVVCELKAINGKNKVLQKYTVVASVTVKVEDTGGLTPSLSVLDPLPVPTAATLSGEITRGRMRSFTQYFVVAGKSLDGECLGHSGSSLTGDLGLAEVVTAGIRATRRGGATPGGNPVKPDNSLFGSTIQFSSKMGLNGGPSVTRTKFKGYGGAAGLANLSRTGTDTLTIAFAAELDKPKQLSPFFTFESLPPDRQSELLEEEAEAAARALLNRMLLENLQLFQP